MVSPSNGALLEELPNDLPHDELPDFTAVGAYTHANVQSAKLCREYRQLWNKKEPPDLKLQVACTVDSYKKEVEKLDPCVSSLPTLMKKAKSKVLA